MLTFRALPEQQLYVVIGTGQASIDVCLKLFTHIQRHAPESRSYRSLVDMRGFTTLMNYQQSERVLEAMSRYELKVERKSAILVAGPAQYGTGRMFEQMGRGHVAVAMRVVENLAEAAAWLEIEESVLAGAMDPNLPDWIHLGDQDKPSLSGGRQG